MKAFWVQVVVFCFSGLNNLIGLYLVVEGNVKTGSIVTVFFTAIIFLIVAAVNPYEIIKIAYSQKGGLSIERHISLPEERKEILKIAQDEPLKKVDEEEKEKLIEAAKNRSDERRSAEDYLALTAEACRTKKYDDGLKLAYAGLNLDPEDKRIKATLINRIGFIYGELKELSLAKKHFKKAIELDSTFFWPHYNLGVFYNDQKKYAEAEKEYKKAIELNPEDVRSHNNLGITYMNQNKNAEAEKEYKKAIELEPEEAHPLFNLGLLYTNQKKYAEAEKEYKKAIELDPDNTLAVNNLKIAQEKIREQG
tara:strand:+ start:1883 stop:2806 length:924 start_codon:yes stop_codon:yes gene_type:complete